MKNPKLLPLAILAENDGEPVEGITRLQKLVFLAQEESGELDFDQYNFEPYDYGPFSKDLYNDLDSLVNNNLVKKKKVPNGNKEPKQIYEITEDGKGMLKFYRENTGVDLPEKEIEEFKSRFNSMPLLDVLSYVYENYPEMTVNSELTI